MRTEVDDVGSGWLAHLGYDGPTYLVNFRECRAMKVRWIIVRR